jgi:hypothetical protein
LICHLYNWLPINRQPVALSEIRNTLNLSVERDTLLLSIRDEVPHVLLLEVLELAAETQEAVRVKILDGLLAQMSGEILADGLEVALNIGRSDLRYARLEMLDRLSERLVGWASDSPEDASQTWQMLFARRKGEVRSKGENGGNGHSAKTAVSRVELLVDLAGLLPFFLLFIPTNHQPGVAIQLIEEMRRLVTGPKLMTVGRKVEEQLIG